MTRKDEWSLPKSVKSNSHNEENKNIIAELHPVLAFSSNRSIGVKASPSKSLSI